MKAPRIPPLASVAVVLLAVLGAAAVSGCTTTGNNGQVRNINYPMGND